MLRHPYKLHPSLLHRLKGEGNRVLLIKEHSFFLHSLPNRRLRVRRRGRVEEREHRARDIEYLLLCWRQLEVILDEGKERIAVKDSAGSVVLVEDEEVLRLLLNQFETCREQRGLRLYFCNLSLHLSEGLIVEDDPVSERDGPQLKIKEGFVRLTKVVEV